MKIIGSHRLYRHKEIPDFIFFKSSVIRLLDFIMINDRLNLFNRMKTQLLRGNHVKFRSLVALCDLKESLKADLVRWSLKYETNISKWSNEYFITQLKYETDVDWITEGT